MRRLYRRGENTKSQCESVQVKRTKVIKQAKPEKKEVRKERKIMQIQE